MVSHVSTHPVSIATYLLTRDIEVYDLAILGQNLLERIRIDVLRDILDKGANLAIALTSVDWLGLLACMISACSLPATSAALLRRIR